jgi:ATP-binding cassette subfamily B protein
MRPYVRPYDRSMVAMTLCAMAGLTASTLIPLVVKAIIDGPIRHHSTGAVVALCVLILVLGTVEAGSMYLRRVVLTVAALGMETDIRNDLYAHLQALPVSFHDRWQTGQLLSRATSDLSTIRRFVGFGVIFLVVNTLTFVLTVGLMVSLYWPLAIVVGLSGAPLVEASRRFERRYQVVSRRQQDQSGDLATLAEEAALGIRVTKAFGRHDVLERRFAAQSEALRVTALERMGLLGRFWSVVELVPNLMLAVVVLVGALAVSRHALSLGGLVAFVSLTLSLSWPINALGWILGTAEEAETASARVWEIFDEVPAITDAPHARAPQPGPGRVRFEGVSFTYPGTSQAVLDDLDLELEPGETMALVGVTGSGKTSLSMLLPRLCDVTGGRVTLDGVDVRDLTLDGLRSRVGVVFEEPILFSASVRENIVLGAPDATDAEVALALDTARADFVSDLPWGLDTRVGEQGLTLSGGQRQRLALARAVVGSPQVLVLDDPLSALDVETEALVEEALARVLVGVTALLVVHRPSTVALADRVAFLEGGRIVAVGTHRQLLDEVPGYRAVLSEAAASRSGQGRS